LEAAVIAAIMHGPKTTVGSGRPEHNGRGQLRSEVAGIAMHGGGWSAVGRFTDADFRHQLLGSKPWLLTQGVPEVPQDPLSPLRGPLGSRLDRERAIGNIPTLVPGPLAPL
jgi:hypothetical protein